MAVTLFAGQLNSNEIFSSIYNMIISQDVHYPELGNAFDLVNKFKVDGTLYGDTKLFYASDVLSSEAWTNYSEASNLLAVKKPDAPKCQAITIDSFRQIFITLDDYLSKRAWATEGAFTSFHGVVKAMLGETKKLYETNLFNVFVGNTVAENTDETKSISLTTPADEEGRRLEAQTISQYLADLLIDMKKYSRAYNDYGFMRAYSPEKLMIIWNSKYVNKITKLDLPTIFHKEDLVPKFDEEMLPPDFFGRAFASTDIDSSSKKAKTGTIIRARFEMTVTTGGVAYHYFPGEQFHKDTTFDASTGDVKDTTKVYVEDATVICKVVSKDTYKFMSAFEVATEFWNPRSLTSNHYLTFGYSTPKYLYDKPLVTVKASYSA